MNNTKMFSAIHVVFAAILFERAWTNTVELSVDEFNKDCLMFHNQVRESFNVTNLVLNKKLIEATTSGLLMLFDGISQSEIPVFKEYSTSIVTLNGAEHDMNCSEAVDLWRDGLSENNYEYMISEKTRLLGCSLAHRNETQSILCAYKSDQVEKRAKKEDLTIAHDSEPFNKQCLIAHNKYRLYHGIPLLNSNVNLLKNAHKRVEEVSDGLGIESLSDDNLGENIISWFSSSNINCKDIVNYWYNQNSQIQNWNALNSVSFEAFSFTQILWKETKRLGCAISSNIPDTWVSIVCKYSPAGNQDGHFTENVPQVTPNSTADTIELDFNEDCLTAHNRLRNVYNKSALVFDKKLLTMASQRVYQLSLDRNAKRTSKQKKYAENLAIWPTSRYSGCATIVDFWYKKTDPGNTKDSSGRFLLNSTKVGCSFSPDLDPKRFLVLCYYQIEEPESPLYTNEVFKNGIRDLTTKEFNQDCLRYHNNYRNKHKKADIAISDEAIEFARERAKQYALQGNVDNLSSAPRFAETFAKWRTNSLLNCSQIVKLWYNEIDFKEDGEADKLNIFSKMLSTSVKAIGCAIVAKASEKSQYVTCSYVQEKLESPILEDQIPVDEINETVLSQVDITDDEFNQECLSAHNQLRDIHSAYPLKISPDAVEFARRRATSLAIKNNPQGLAHDSGKYGENLASWYSKTRLNCSKVVQLWYDEIHLVKDWADPEASGAPVFHFTQVIWKNTKYLGCGIAKGQTGSWVYVSCNYSPAGNYQTEFLENVQPPKMLPKIGVEYNQTVHSER